MKLFNNRALSPCNYAKITLKTGRSYRALKKM